MAESYETIDFLLNSQSNGSLSTSSLYKFLFNNLRLGQWELARACIGTLVQRDSSHGKSIAEILKDIIKEPLRYCDGSSSVPTPFHLSWLCLLEFFKHYDGKVQLPEGLQKKVEFRLLLQCCRCQEISLQFLQELDDYHSQLVTRNHGQADQRSPDINPSWLKPLKNLIHRQPQVAHTVIQHLVGSGEVFRANNAFFGSLYLDLIREHMNTLDALEVSLKQITDFDHLDESKQNAVKLHQLCCESIHQLLVMGNLYLNTEEMEVDELLMNLLHKVQSKPCEQLSKASVYSALLSHSTHFLYQKFCEIENGWELGVCSSSSMPEVMPSARMFIPAETLLTRSCGRDRLDAWKLLYFYARRNHHILEDVVKSCVEFVRQGDFDRMTEILSCKEFSPLRVLVLLLAWPFCHTCDSAQQLLDILWDSDKSTKHMLLDQACARLEYQVHLVKWCLDETKPLISASESAADDHEKAHRMFQSLDSHSVLHVLHQSTNLSQLPENEVLDILRTRPVFSSTPSSQRQDSNNDSGNSEKLCDERYEIRRDVALYHGFCALRGFMQVVALSRNKDEESVSAVETKIREAQDHVNKIFPLTFRVEVLENVFSLLFVSSEHLLEDGSQVAGSDDLETLESRSLRSSRTASFDSFLSIDSRNTSPWRPSRPGENVSGVELSASRTVSPEPLRNIDENLAENDSRPPGLHHDSSKLIPKDHPGEQVNVESVVAEERAKLSSRSTRISRELHYDDVVAPSKETVEPNEVFQPPLERSEKMLELSGTRVKGLLVSKSLVGQLLDVLKDSLTEVLELKADQTEQRGSIHADWIQTSVSMTILEQRLSRLGQYINEAQWRHQLVSTCCHENESDDELSDDQLTLSSDGESDFEQEFSEVQSDDGFHQPRRRRTRRTKDKIFDKPLTTVALQDSSIPRLLSSPCSLIYMCMKRDNYGQAKHIIHLFSVDDDSSRALVFAEEYEKAFQKLTVQEKNKTREKNTKTSAKKGRLSVLKNVATAAAAGIASVSSATVVEELMLAASVDLTSSGLMLTEPAHAHFVCALVCFDFLCTGQVSRQLCQSFLEKATQKMVLGMDIEPSTPYTLRHFAEFLANLEGLLHDDPETMNTLDVLFGDIKPLNAKTLKNDRELQAQQDVAFSRLEEAIEDGDAVIKSIAEKPATKTSAVLKFKKMEQNTAVRVAMIEFQSAFDCDRDGRLMVTRKSKWLSQTSLDYVQSLYNHVNMLSTWELYWKMNSKERGSVHLGSKKPIALKATNPFVVLTQGFDDLAGKPLFERNVPPRSMESMCRKMNVSLIRIIVHNCCPVIPALGPSRKHGSLLSSSAKVVLNDPMADERTEVGDPVRFAEELLTKMKGSLQGMCDPDTGMVDLQSLVLLSTSPSYFVVLKESRELSWVDLNQLTSDDDKICFFTNILNTLLTHAAIAELTEGSPTRRNESRRNKSEGDNSGDRNSFMASWKHDLPRLDTSYCRAAYLKKYGYNIGQLGFVSAFDLWFIVLRAGLHFPANMQNMSTSSQGSRYERYQPRKSDFRLTFVINDGTVSAPEMQVLSKESRHSQLDEAMSCYLCRNVTINYEDEKISLPELLKWYQKDFTSRTVVALSSEPVQTRFVDNENWVELLLQLSPYLHEEHFKNLEDVVARLMVTFTPHCWQFGYQFPSRGMLPERKFPLYPGQTGPKASMNEPKYSLTQGLSSYLTGRSPLVAALAKLSCGQDSSKDGGRKRQASDEDFPSFLKSFTNTDTHSSEVTSPFEFSLDKTATFPVLQRHITSSYYSVLKFLYLGGLGLIQPPSSQAVSSATDLLIHAQSRLYLLDEASPEVSDVFLRAVDYALQKGDWELLLDIFRSPNLKDHGGVGDPEDFVLEMAFRSGLETNQEDDIATQISAALKSYDIPAPDFDLNWKKKPWLLLYRIHEDDLRARIVLQSLHKWSDEAVCLELLNFCCSRPPRHEELLESLDKKTKQMKLCEKIMKCYRSRPSGSSDTEYENWKSIVEESLRNPESVVKTLMKHEQFDLVREWMEIYGHPSQLRQQIHEEYLKHLLKKSHVDITEVYMYLEEIGDPLKTLTICESLLTESLAVPNVVFIIHFMITDLADVLTARRKRELLRQKLGASALVSIPESHHRPYESLVSQPLLLLEQLLMDMKVEWSAKVFSDLQSELRTNLDYDDSLRKEVSVDAFEKLLITYASKALEFELVSYEQAEDRNSPSRSGSAKKRTGSVGYRKTSTPVRTHQRNASTGSTVSSLHSLGTGTELPPDQFKIPEQVPAEEDWEPDDRHSVCMICKEVSFNMFVRRHHCRRCGRVVCDNCSPFKRVLKNYGRIPVRVCKDCDQTIYEEAFKHKKSSGSFHTGSLPTYLHKSVDGPASAGLPDRLGTVVSQSAEDEFNFNVYHGWKLSLDHDWNELIRSEFLYEQAPSSSLCTSILALHSNSKTCGELLLELSNKLSQKLGRSEEIDSNLLISIICQLLLHAKLNFTNCGETHGVELCDTYRSRVELAKFLIESNFYEVPCIEDLMSLHTARRLRDRLIENESLSLAMEVTTKCGLDPGAVWGAWGLAYLQVGKFSEARQKFSKFLKPSDRGKSIKGNVRYLQRIIEILETCPMISYDDFTICNLGESLARLRDRAKTEGAARTLEKPFEECLFYLKTYGSYSAVVSFYVKHDELVLACRFISDKRCAPEIFSESLLMPTIRSGRFEELRGILKRSDPSLEVWIPYLNASCSYLSRSNYLNVLYQIQLLIKDYFRAAMTCIKFYQGLPHQPASNYSDLFLRTNYLDDAKSHLEAVRKHQQSKKGTLAMVANSLSLSETSEDKTRMTVTPTELTNYMNAVTLQFEVTKFMHNCYIEGTARKPKSVTSKLGTLFDNANVKCEVVSEVLLAGSTVDDGFTLACRIIQDFRLPAVTVYKAVSVKLAEQQKFGEIQTLLTSALQTRLVSERDHDGVIVGVLGTFSGDDRKWKQAETLIKLLKDEGKKIAACISFGRLKKAYLIAVAQERVEDIRTIASMAKETDQTKVHSICVRWLESYAERRQRQDDYNAGDWEGV